MWLISKGLGEGEAMHHGIHGIMDPWIGLPCVKRVHTDLSPFRSMPPTAAMILEVSARPGKIRGVHYMFCNRKSLKRSSAFTWQVEITFERRQGWGEGHSESESLVLSLLNRQHEQQLTAVCMTSGCARDLEYETI